MGRWFKSIRSAYIAISWRACCSNIDSFSKQNILIAATNHPELLDKAIWRRFNTVIEIGLPGDEELSGLLDLHLKDFTTDFTDDKKKLDKIIRLLEGKTPSDVKSILNKAKAQCVVNEKKVLAFEDVLIAIYEFNNHGASSIEKMVEFLNENGVAQLAIAENLKLSMRQIRNYLNKQS